MNREDVRTAKAAILRCLTQEFTYGPTTERPHARLKSNRPLFDGVKGWAVYSNTDLEMGMDKVVLGLYFAMDDSRKESVKAAEVDQTSEIG